MAKANVALTQVVPSETQVYPYYDDFNEDKNFKRIIFRPGYAVQARELTQIQTIMQNQIERFGKHIFVDGSSVIGGEVRFGQTATLNLEVNYANSAVNVASFVDKTVTFGANSTVLARVVQATEATTNDPPTLYLNYITGNEFGPGATIKVQDEETYANVVSSANASSNGIVSFIDDSIFFYSGYFVKVPKQKIVASKYTTSANCKVGLEFDDSIVTELDDTSLLDPALESSNYQAPGAARYKAELVLAKRDLNSTDLAKFIELVRVENGVLKKNVKTPTYSEIEEVLARRTFDESGNYTVDAFRIVMEDSTANSTANVAAVLSEGKGYIYGYEFETISPTKLEIPRARTKSAISNYNLNTNYGNYVYVKDMNGLFDITSMEVADVHCVPNGVFSTASSAAYNSTKIGTVRVQNLEYYSGSAVADREYELYFFDFQANSISNTAVTGTSNSINIGSSYSTATDAYRGAQIIITGGTSSGDVRTITSYNGASWNVRVDTAFTATPDGTSTFKITFGPEHIESFAKNSVFTPGATSNAAANVSVTSKDTGLATGNTVIQEKTLTSLVFPLPDKYIVESSLTDKQWTYRRLYEDVAFTSGVSAPISATSGEDFIGTTGAHTSSTVLDNFLVVRQDTKAVVSCSVSVAAGPPESATFTQNGATDTFTADVYAKMQITDNTLAAPRTKTIVPANTATFASESATTIVNPSGSTTRIYADTGQVVISNPSREYNIKESLYLADVSAIPVIYDLAGAAIPSAGADITGYTDVTNRYQFDNGQRDWIYDHASIALKPGYVAATGPLIVCCRYYKTISDSGYFSVDSYNPTASVTENGVVIGTGYTLIPNYGGRNLRDCIDFRPVRQNASNTSPNYTIVGAKLSNPTLDFQTDYEYYLGRKDLVVLTSDRELKTISGIPSKYPHPPKVPSRSMVLHELTVPPYTEHAANVSVKFIENKRYTMRDIGQIDKRLENVEYYVTLNTLEKDALDIQITDVDGLERTKHGIFVDGFTGHELGDTESVDYRIAVDVDGSVSGDGVALNEFATKGIALIPDDTNATNITVRQGKATLSYTTEPFISQNVASKFTPVADQVFAAFDGDIYTKPSADVWKDVNKKVVINKTVDRQVKTSTSRLNLQRYVGTYQAQAEARKIKQGESPEDVLRDWARHTLNRKTWPSDLAPYAKQNRRVARAILNAGDDLDLLNDILNGDR